MKRTTLVLLSTVALGGSALALVAVTARATSAAPAAPTAGAVVRVDPAQIALIDVAGNRPQVLRDVAGRKATLVFFSSNECPVALAYEQELAVALPGLQQRGIALVAVSSSYADSRESIDRHRTAAKLPYPMYQDVGGRLAAALGAGRTSEVALLGPDGRVVYQGRIDDRVTPVVRRARATTHELADAVDDFVAGKPVRVARTQAAGCVIPRARAQTASEADAKVTYGQHVAPILQRYCINCHRPGEAGPMSLVGYEQAAAWSDTIVEVLRENRMPPSRLSPPDPRYGSFIETPAPSAAEIDTIAAWLAAGTPQGPADRAAVEPATTGWAIGKPDLIVSAPVSFTVPATGVVDYQYYELPVYTGPERWVEAIEVRPGARSVIHHANLYMSQPELKTVDFAGGERWASYAPGRVPTTFPTGVARRLPTGAKLRLEIHYTPDGVAHDDLTRIGIKFATKRPRYEARSVAVGTMSFEIPPGAANHEVVGQYTLKGNGRIASFTPHMHDRGKDFRYEAILPDGTRRTLLFVPRYNFAWQFVYVPKDMIALPKGTVLRSTAHYDNSAGNPQNPDPSKPVSFGLQTWEEMMYGFVDLVYDEDIDSPKLRELRLADHASAPQDRGFESWDAFGAWWRKRQPARP